MRLDGLKVQKEAAKHQKWYRQSRPFQITATIAARAFRGTIQQFDLKTLNSYKFDKSTKTSLNHKINTMRADLKTTKT